MGGGEIENKIFIKKAICDCLLGHCSKDPSKESCGILAGTGRKIEKIFPLTNVSDTPELCYMIDPGEQLGIFKELRKDNLEMLAIFHSHVNVEAYPSRKDIELAFYPDSSYIIVSLDSRNPPSVRSFRINDGKITEEELVIED